MVTALEAERKPIYRNDRIPVETINVLAQPRKTFEDIPSLAGSILDIGLMNPLIVARFDLVGARSYVDVVNNLWKSSANMADLTENQLGEYDILIAGERRLRAIRLLIADGSYLQRFGDQSVDVRLMEGVDPYEAVKRQIQENIHVRVPPAEEAQAYNDYYRVKKKSEPKYSMRQFARDVGRAPETVKIALKFCELPGHIQDLVLGGKIGYGIALELARLKDELGLDGEVLNYWTLRAMTGEFKVPEFRKLISNYIFEQKSGQTMMELFTKEQRREMDRGHIRRVVADEWVRGVWNGINYNNKIRQLLDNGYLGTEDSPYSSGSPRRIYGAFIKQLKGLLPFLREGLLIDDDGVVEEGSKVIAHLEKLLVVA